MEYQRIEIKPVIKWFVSFVILLMNMHKKHECPNLICCPLFFQSNSNIKTIAFTVKHTNCDLTKKSCVYIFKQLVIDERLHDSPDMHYCKSYSSSD